MPAEMEPAHERERPQAVGLAQDLGDQRGGLRAARGKQDPHARPEAPDSLLDADGGGPPGPGPGSGRAGQRATEAVERQDHGAQANLAEIPARAMLGLTRSRAVATPMRVG